METRIKTSASTGYSGFQRSAVKHKVYGSVAKSMILERFIILKTAVASSVRRILKRGGGQELQKN